MYDMHNQLDYQKERMRDFEREAEAYRKAKQARKGLNKPNRMPSLSLTRVLNWLSTPRKSAPRRAKHAARPGIQGMEF
ncbi:MAG: hypothetical protein K8L99_34725 [Anaerolineae bacterium]|nr:hypothetical protein [Anaerolineae bacterium]